jgi:hypothetical protein
MTEKPITNDDCIKWKKNKLVNPHTDYHFKAKEKSAIYKKFAKACKEVATPVQPIVKAVEIPNQKEVITSEACYKWLKSNKKINPVTDKPIKQSEKSNSLYKKLEDACIKLKIIDPKTKEPLVKISNQVEIKQKQIDIAKIKNPIYKLKKKITKEDCLKWKKEPLKNPQSKDGKQKIQEGGPIYKELEEECKKFKIIVNKNDIKDAHQEPKKQTKITENNKIRTNIIKPIIKPKVVVNIKKPKRNVIFNDNNDNNNDLYYPDLNDIDFNKKLLELKEIRVHKINDYPDIKTITDFEQKANELCSGFDKSSFQYLMAHYLSYRTPYRSLLLYYSVGIGKTCSAITIAESLLINHNTYEEPKIWVILPGAIEGGFKNQIFDIMKTADFSTIGNQCTGDTYVKLSQISKETDSKIIEKRIKKLIKSRYLFFTYEGFANFIETNYTQKNKIVKDKVIIVDEAHNIRSGGNNDENKRVYDALIDVCKPGINNRLILLTATPMYNEPTDIYNLFYLLLINDKREELYNDNLKIFDNENKLTQNAKEFISLMSSNYISYLRGKNPFNFAFKLSPKLSGIPVLENTLPLMGNGKPIEETDKDWLKKMDNDIVISKLSNLQINYLKAKKMLYEDTNVGNNFNSDQIMNIIYDNTSGKEGFNNFFIRQGEGEQIIVKYATKYKNALMPDDKHLGLYSGKFLNIINLIKKSKGIVVVYSRFKWAGVIPLAIALEHLGFSREGTTNLLAEPNVSEKVEYEGIKTPKYCILSSTDPEVMGNTTIDNLMSKINNPGNINGELVKVILMTPVAGEGLNFFNIRELHVTDPWYHFNKVDQIIGRGIRNCSHKNLPVQQRNVTVFLHASIVDLNRETIDISAYRIATRKLYQSFIIDEIIKNNAIDCSLFKSINYFPSSMFKLGNIDIITSQGKKIKYKLGDDDKYKPVCKIDMDKLKENSKGFREETYKHLAINIQTKIKNLILDLIHNNKRFVSYKYLKEVFNYVDFKILMHSIKISIYPNTLIDNLILIPHQDGLHIIDVIEDTPLKLQIISNTIDNTDVVDVKNDFYEKIHGINNDNYYNAIISLYTSLDETTFKLLINKIFKTKDLNKIDSFIENCFAKEGVLIKNKEIPLVTSNVHDKYIGFVNIFNEDFEPLLYDKEGNHMSLNQKQLTQLKSNRKYIQKPVDFMKEVKPWGLIIPMVEKETKIKMNTFKLLTPGVIYGKKTGIVCSSLKKGDHITILKQLNLPLDTGGKNTKFTYCNSIAIELVKINRMTLLPEFKPK